MRDFTERPSWTMKLKSYFPKKGIKVISDDEYIVEIHRTSCHWGDSIRLSITRIDKSPIHSWRDLQRIKDQVAGEDRTAIEIYPKKKDVTDTANIYHLWILPEDFELPYRLIPYQEP